MPSSGKENRLKALQRQVDRLEQRIAYLNRISYRYSWVRLVLFAMGLLAGSLAWHLVGLWLAGVALVLFGLAFGAVVYFHRRVDHSIKRHRIWRRIKLAQVARMRLDWERIPAVFGYQPRRDHPFELDLDLVGRRSLYRLLDTAVSYEGSRRLREWLTAPIPDPAQTVRRRRRVRELVPLSLFRDKLVLNATLASGTGKSWQAGRLVEWLQEEGAGTSLKRWLLVAGGMAALNAVLFVAAWLGLVPSVWRVTFVLYFGLFLLGSRVTQPLFDEAMALQDALEQLGAVFGQLETFAYQGTPHLKALCAPFLEDARRPSRYLSRIARVVAALGIRGNGLAWFLLNAPLPWDFYFAYRLERHKTEIARLAPAWMDVWFELEASSSLANFAYLNPYCTFPHLLGDGDLDSPAVFRARGLGHPLIPDAERVCNDFVVPELGRVTLITGSNMTGKSVFLKTVGINLALAYAGGPVVAQYLQTAVFRLFSSMKVSDSVTGGLSYFYAEVQRLKRLLAELSRDHPLPLVFFIDEIFRGTNNRERLIGSRAYVRALAGRHGIGFIATHDLELARLADQLSPVENYHFRDHFVDGRMTFDYTIRPGPCPTTNALEIMRMEGLPVE